tara:strand:- start:4986 stop:5669 length:684 start_codon:yes stop_codon:yes gene_type:complete
MILLIDTSTRNASVGLAKNEHILKEINWVSQKNHSVELLPNIKELFDSSGEKQSNLDSIFVVNGPGSFSATRVGVSVAKAIASTLNISLIGINSLLVEFEPFKSQHKNCWAIIPAGKLKYYVGIFSESDYDINDAPEMNIMNHKELIDEIPNNTFICGEGAFDIYSDPTSTVKQIQLLSSTRPTRKCISIYNLGNKKLGSNSVDNPLTLEPIYLRSSQIANANKNSN